MIYVLIAMYAILIGSVIGWIFYNACTGSKKDRLFTGIMWGVGTAIIAALASIGS